MINSIYIEMLIPALFTAASFFAIGKFKDSKRARLQATALGFAFALGWMLFGRSILGQGYLGMTEDGHGFLWSAILLVGFVWWNPGGLGARYLVRAIFVVAIGALVLAPMRAHLVGSVHLRNLLAFFFLGLGVWSILERSSQTVKTPTLVLLPTLTVAALAELLILRQVPIGGLTGTVLLHLALLVSVLIVALAKPERVSPAAIIPAVSVFVVALLAATHFYLSINPWSLIFLCIPYVFLWIRPWLVFVPRSAHLEALLLGVLGAMPLAYFFWH